MLLSWTGILNCLNQRGTFLSPRKVLQDIILSLIFTFSLFPLFSMDLGVNITLHRNSRLKGKVLWQPWPLFWVIRLGWLRSVGMSPNLLLQRLMWHEGGWAICPVMGSQQCAHPTFKLLQSIGKRTSKHFFPLQVFSPQSQVEYCV